MVLIPDLCLMADNSIYLQNIYSGKVTTLSRKQASNLQYYYRRSKIPSDENEYIYDYTYSRFESILRMLIGKYKQNKILNIDRIHAHELCYEFYNQYFADIEFDNIKYTDNIMKNPRLPLEFILKKIDNMVDQNKRTYTIKSLFQNSPYIEDLYDNYMHYTDKQSLQFLITNNKYINANMFKKNSSKYTEYQYYVYLNYCTDIDIIDQIRFINTIEDIDDRSEWIYGFLLIAVDYSETEFVYIIENLLGLIDMQYRAILNSKLSNTLIKKYIIPSIVINKSSFKHLYDEFISHPNVYLEDILAIGIDLNTYNNPRSILSNPNLPIPSINQITDNYYEECIFLSNSRITNDIIDKYMDNPDWFDNMESITTNPNMTQLQFKRIIKYCECQGLLCKIDWIAVFNNPNISIKYIEKIFRKHPDLFA